MDEHVKFYIKLHRVFPNNYIKEIFINVAYISLWNDGEVYVVGNDCPYNVTESAYEIYQLILKATA